MGWCQAADVISLCLAVLLATIQHVDNVLGPAWPCIRWAYLLRGLSLLPLLLTLSAALSAPLSPAAAVGLAARSAAAKGELEDAARGELCLAALGLSRLAACCSAALELGDDGCCCCLLGAADLLLLTPVLSCSPLRGE